MWIVITDISDGTVTVRNEDIKKINRPRWGRAYIMLQSTEIVEVKNEEAERISALLVNGVNAEEPELPEKEPAEVTA